MKRNGFSRRRFHVKRRADVDDAEVAEFLADWEAFAPQFESKNILNVDETSWKVLNNRCVTVALRGKDGVTCKFGSDEKECITVIAAIALDGTKLPLWVLAKGKTERREAKFRDDTRLKKLKEWVIIEHSESGWNSGDVARKYLNWLHKWNQGDHKYVLWDLYASHRSEDTKRHCLEKEITLQYIPNGQTGVWQPLDWRIFGELKMRAKQRFDKVFSDALLHGTEPHFDIVDAIGILGELWKETKEENVRRAWRRLTGECSSSDEE